jgi:acyl-CoA synthetase (AMP-forming)/AMP-acid ligase II
MPGRCSASARTTWCIRRPSCSSPTASATADLPDVGRRHGGADGRAADAAGGVQAPARAQADDLLRRADALRRAARQPRLPKRRSCACACAPPPARRCRPTSASAGRSTSASRSSTASAPPRCCTSSSPTVPARCATAPPARPVPGYGMRLIGEDGQPVGQGEIGELQISGPSAAAMYWNNREKSRHTFMGEWTRSGDKYTRRRRLLHYCGRSDDMLKVAASMSRPSRSRRADDARGGAGGRRGGARRHR